MMLRLLYSWLLAQKLEKGLILLVEAFDLDMILAQNFKELPVKCGTSCDLGLAGFFYHT